jgi:exodeoxyribonuclease VII large subunit
MEQKLTLFELNQRIKDVLCEAIPGTVWVVAEISELKENRNGHCYLELVEKQGTEIVARARATVWSYTYRILKPYFETITGQFFSCGIKILVQVAVEFHPAYGFSLNIKDIDPAYTMGDMLLQRKEIIDRLHSEGIFDMNKELPLPLVPQNIAVISSATAAGYQDFINQLETNHRGFKFYHRLFEAYMQGSGAVPSIIAALERVFQYDDFFDAVVIIRGGGAVADLSIFDNYDLAFYITQFPLPVITGIGHEKDDSIADMVAHTRLKTPTAVAEFLIDGAERFYERLTGLEERMEELLNEILLLKKEQLENSAATLKQLVGDFIAERNRQLIRTGGYLHKKVSNFSFGKKYELNDLRHNLNSVMSVWKIQSDNNLNRYRKNLKWMVNDVLNNEKTGLKQLKKRIINESVRYVEKESERIQQNENAARLLNPQNVLKRGFTITLKDGKIVKSTVPLHMGDEIETRFADGNVKSNIIKKG